MSRDEWTDVLSSADETASPPPRVGPDLARVVRARAARRDRRRRATVGTLLALAVAGLALRLSRPVTPVQVVSRQAESVRQARIELARLEKKAVELQKLALATRDATAARPVHFAPPPEDPLERIESARNRAALILLKDTDAGGADARESLQRIARLFPETPAGREATERLATGSLHL